MLSFGGLNRIRTSRQCSVSSLPGLTRQSIEIKAFFEE
jgi:ribosome biogenesis GTPase A